MKSPRPSFIPPAINREKVNGLKLFNGKQNFAYVLLVVQMFDSYSL